MILRILSNFIFLIKALDFLYLFQTKEYRLDRIRNFLLEQNLFQLLFLRTPRLPAKSARNIIISVWIFFSLALFIFTERLLNLDRSFFITFIKIVMAPVAGLIGTFIGVILTEPLALMHRKYLIKKASAKISDSKTIFIGITGSYGKTSTKEYLYQILSQKFRVAKTDKNHNSEVGVAISILKNLKPDTEYFIAELGAYRRGEIKATCGLIHPKYGILTGIGNQHLSLFGSKQNLKEAKAELLEALPKDGIAYINMDIEDRKFFAEKTKAKKIFYSVANPLSEIKTNLLGMHNTQNLLPCVALAIQLGMDKKQIDKKLLSLQPVEGRLSRQIGINGSTVLNDSYNSNLQGFQSALNTANQMTEFSQKLVLSRGIIELGAEKSKSYQKIIDELNKSDLTLLTTDKLFKDLDQQTKVKYFTNESMLVEYLRKTVSKKTVLIVEGRFEPKTLQFLLDKNDFN